VIADREQYQGNGAEGEAHVADDVDGALPAVELGQEEPSGGLVQEGGAGQGKAVGAAPALTPGPAGDHDGHGGHHHHAERDPCPGLAPPAEEERRREGDRGDQPRAWGWPVGHPAGAPADREGEADQGGGHHRDGGQLRRRGEEATGVLLHVPEDEDRAEEVEGAGRMP